MPTTPMNGSTNGLYLAFGWGVCLAWDGSDSCAEMFTASQPWRSLCLHSMPEVFIFYRRFHLHRFAAHPHHLPRFFLCRVVHCFYVVFACHYVVRTFFQALSVFNVLHMLLGGLIGAALHALGLKYYVADGALHAIRKTSTLQAFRHVTPISLTSCSALWKVYWHRL